MIESLTLKLSILSHGVMYTEMSRVITTCRPPVYQPVDANEISLTLLMLNNTSAPTASKKPQQSVLQSHQEFPKNTKGVSCMC